MKHFSKYIERCGAELERGLPVVDILLYLGDDVGYRPSEHKLMFDNRYKYDYLNNDALMTRVDAKDGKIVLPDGMSYRVIWVPKGTFLLPATEAKLGELEKKGARVVRGDFVPDWPSPIKEFLGRDGANVAGWQQRRDGDTNTFFLVENNGTSVFLRMIDGEQRCEMFNPVTGQESDFLDEFMKGSRVPSTSAAVELKPEDNYPAWATKRVYRGRLEVPPGTCECRLDLGAVRDWATVFVDGRKVADLWCEPYACDIMPYVKPGASAEIRVETVSTWYNALVHDASLPEAERTTWTKKGPEADAPYHDAGLLGPVRFFFRTNDKDKEE